MPTPTPSSESIWHDPSFVSRRERERNLRFARARCRDGEYVSPEREAEVLRDARYDSAHPKPKGDPSRRMPLAFDEHGVFIPALTSRMSPQQAEQAHLLLENGLVGKARRHAWCGLVGRRKDCIENPEHRFFKPHRCYLRYCPVCGPLCFRELFGKHSRLAVVVEQLLQHGFAVEK